VVKELNSNKLVIPEQNITDPDSCNVNVDEVAVELVDSSCDSEPDIPVLKYSYLPDNHLNCDVTEVLAWENLCEALQTVFPPDEKYTYVIELFQGTPRECFDGAPPFSFSCKIRINLTDQAEALEWLDKMQEHSLTTYRITRTFKAGGSRVLYKTERHCQHFRKILTPKQKAASAMTKSKKAKKPLTGESRNKKTQCSSRLTLTIQIPTKKQRIMASKSKPYLLTHTAVLSLEFVHNHPITSGHALSFRDIAESSKENFHKLFENGHSPSSARHAHEQTLYLESNTEMDAQETLADRAKNPLLSDICRLFTKWRETNYGADDGKELFEKLQEKIDEYNAVNNEIGGKAMLQWYEQTSEGDEIDDTDTKVDDTDTNVVEKPKCKKRKRIKPMILAICTPLMARAHQDVRQAGELVFCDASSSLDRFNTSLFVLSTTTACSGIPLATFMVSDETEDTECQALELVKQVLPSSAFFGNGAQTGPAVFMIDDSVVEHTALLKSWPSARLLLCTFHFLQRQWTWLHNGQNKITNADRLSLIKDVRSLTYCKTESALLTQYEHLLDSATAKKYPNFITSKRSGKNGLPGHTVIVNPY